MAGYEEAGKIVVDMTFLKTEGHIQPIVPPEPNARKHYRVTFDLVLTISGRNLNCEARYPCGASDKYAIRQKARICVASAFLKEMEDGG
ncbi:hypothetical protein D8B26_007714 [Coccidioides posadasii str. Silveira]|uniref:uncharacterized protein n=1 Tax=Coccidioides posadasii (strain RMSCC 757 / Silveira) TaxID=443226 RepID=UPI001BF1566E|nr:hypothetical protein D8B26_007714 [Coccidioides posadasii str. Silveira]